MSRVRTCKYDYSQELGEERSPDKRDTRYNCGLPAEHHIIAFDLDHQEDMLIARTATFACTAHMRMVGPSWTARGITWLNHPIGEHCLGDIFAIDTVANVCVRAPGIEIITG